MEVLDGGFIGGIQRKRCTIVLLGLKTVAPDLHECSKEMKGLGTARIDGDRLAHMFDGRIEMARSNAPLRKFNARGVIRQFLPIEFLPVSFDSKAQSKGSYNFCKKRQAF